MKQYTAEELSKLNKEDVVALLLQAQKQNALFMEQISVMQAQRFGRKTEKLETLVGQLGMFNEAEAEAAKEPETEEEEPETEEIIYTRNKKKPGTLDEMLKDLPVREEQHVLTEEELTEIFGENGWKQLPDEIYRKLEYHPATKEVVEHHIAVYAAKKEDRIVRATHPVELLNHSIATPSLVAAVMNGKYYKQLKKKWKVSIAAMIRRAENLGVLTTDEYQDLIRTMQRRGIRKEEPLDDVLVTAAPALLKTSVIMLLQEGVFTSKEFMEDLSTEYGLSINPEEIEYLIGLPAGTLAPPKIIDISSIQLKRK